MGDAMEIRSVALVDNDPFTLRALAGLVEDMRGSRVAWTARSAVQALELCADERTAPDLLVTDVSMPDMDGVALCRLIRSRTPDIPVLAVTSYNLEIYAARAAAAGAQGIVNKDDTREIAAAIAAVGGGAIWPYRPDGAPAVRFRTAPEAFGHVEASHAAQALASLSAGELAVVRLTCETLGTFAQIAASTGRSESAVKTMAQRAYRKLGVANKRELMALWNEGILS